MRLMRLTAAAVLICCAAARTSSAQCVSEVRQVASRSSFTTLVAGPIAWNGSILAVASNQDETASVWVSLFSEHGDLLYPSVKVPSSDDSELISIFWNGNHFALFYETDDHFLVLRRISTQGELIGAEIRPLPKLKLADADRLDILWSDSLAAYVIARTVTTSPRGLWLTYVNLDGTVRSNVQVGVPAADSIVKIAITDSLIIGVFYEQDVSHNLMLLRVAQGEPNFLRKVWTPGLDDDLVVTSADNQFVLARTDVQPDTRKTIRWKIVDSTGFDVRQDSRLLIGSGQDVRPLSLMERNGEFALTYLDSREGFATQTPSFRLRRFEIDGDTISDTYFSAADRTHHRAKSEDDFVWTGSAYLTVAARETDDGTDSFLLRICPLIAHVSAPRTINRGQTVTFNGSAEGGVPAYQYAWKWGERDTATGQTLQLRYDTPGFYTVTLVVTDDSDTQAVETFTLTVIDAPPPPSPPKHRSVRK
jgi:hypothetical protein